MTRISVYNINMSFWVTFRYYLGSFYDYFALFQPILALFWRILAYFGPISPYFGKLWDNRPRAVPGRPKPSQIRPRPSQSRPGHPKSIFMMLSRHKAVSRSSQAIPTIVECCAIFYQYCTYTIYTISNFQTWNTIHILPIKQYCNNIVFANFIYTI